MPGIQAPKTPTLMFMGTGSDVGKSLIVAGLCRLFSNQGLRVQPFKPQNMSNNAAVTLDGGEIGRAQALQARACRLDPGVHMNPILLKPQSEIGSQIVVQGRLHGTAKAAEYQDLKGGLMPFVLESFAHQQSNADLVLVEGAGSASEVNLRKGDIANWGFATATQTPVVLIGDIDRGGVIASLVGTYSLIAQQERDLLAGYMINKFRGDTTLFDSAIETLGAATGLRSFGIAPYFCDAHKLPAEDALALDQRQQSHPDQGLKIFVLRTPRLSNFDEFDPLMLEPGVSLTFLNPGSALPGDADLVILGGSKATIADLDFIRRQGWDLDLHAHVRRGGRLMGICGGYQMLGKEIHDPEGIEGTASRVQGLGFLNISTTLTDQKTLQYVEGKHHDFQVPVQGYEMHVGRSTGDDTARPYLNLKDRTDGAQSREGQVFGTYVHGLFAGEDFRAAWLKSLGGSASDLIFDQQIDSVLDHLAEHLSQSLDTQALIAAARAV